ncbi:MAG: dicarboxylate/amino acid:cation symporter [Chlamydiia bacterium]|nr:dicarboxylate/amino acid:cation symporter [Chlamydiia bacterium]
MKLWLKILIALILGIVAGVVLGPKAQALKPVGDAFLNLIRMLVPLLVLASMTVGITSIHDPKKLGRVGLRSMIFFLGTTAFAIGLGLLIAFIVGPGEGVNLQMEGGVQLHVPHRTLTEMILAMIPSNPIASLVEENILQIIVFALFLGVAINFSGDRGRILKDWLESLADVMYRLTSIIMEFSPIGVFALMASVAGSYGYQVLLSLMKFLTAYYVACFLHIGLVFVAILHFIVRLQPIPFFKGMGDAIMIAFSTSSSTATLPASMHCVQENLGVSPNISRFVLPLGSTVNMNGSAIFQGMSAVFVAQAYGIHLDWVQLLTIVVTGTLSAIGAPGIPGAGIIVLSIVFGSVGLPIEGIGILYGIDRVREMMSTVLNVLGDSLCAVYVAKSEREFDEDRYYHADLVEFEHSDV